MRHNWIAYSVVLKPPLRRHTHPSLFTEKLEHCECSGQGPGFCPEHSQCSQFDLARETCFLKDSSVESGRNRTGNGIINTNICSVFLVTVESFDLVICVPCDTCTSLI